MAERDPKPGSAAPRSRPGARPGPGTRWRPVPWAHRCRPRPRPPPPAGAAGPARDRRRTGAGPGPRPVRSASPMASLRTAGWAAMAGASSRPRADSISGATGSERPREDSICTATVRAADAALGRITPSTSSPATTSRSRSRDRSPLIRTQTARSYWPAGRPRCRGARPGRRPWPTGPRRPPGPGSRPPEPPRRTVRTPWRRGRDGRPGRRGSCGALGNSTHCDQGVNRCSLP